MSWPQGKFQALTWNTMYTMMLNQAKKILENGFNPDIVLGVARGGLVPARVLSDLLENANVSVVQTEFYKGFGKSYPQPTLTHPLSVSVAGKTLLIVDDIADTGRSLNLVKENVVQKGAKEIKTATLFCKPWSGIVPDYFERETKHWVVFPWDLKETIRNAFESWGKMPILDLSNRLKNAGLSESLVDRFLKEIIREDLC